MRLFQFLFISFLLLSVSQAQDNLYSLKTGNVNHFNPALVGVQSDLAVNLAYRDQSSMLSGQNSTASILTNYNLKNKLGFGLELSEERGGEGLYQTTVIKGNINYSFIKKEVKTRVGLNFGYRESNINWQTLKFEDQIDPSRGFSNSTAEQITENPSQAILLDFGFVSEYKNIIFGLSAMQFNQPNVSILTHNGNTILPTRWVSTLGYTKKVKEVNFSGLLTSQFQSQSTLLTTQVTSQYKFARIGVGYRQVFGEYKNNGWLLASAGIQFDKFQISYAYDSYYVEAGSRQNI